jgi:hypothetical protein
MATPGEFTFNAILNHGNRPMEFTSITLGLAYMIGRAELRRRINAVASYDPNGDEDISENWKPICRGIESYFLRMLPGSSVASKQQAQLNAERAKRELDRMNMISERERQRIAAFGDTPRTQPHMVDDDEDEDESFFEEEQRRLAAFGQRPTVHGRRRQPRPEDYESQRRQLQWALQPTGRMPSGVPQRRLRNQVIVPDDEDEDDEEYEEAEEEEDDDAFGGGSASGSKKRGPKPKPKKRIATKSKGKKRVLKREK